MVAVNVFQKLLGLVSTLILARLLPPADFGLVAMATVLVGFLQVLTQFGFDAALIQKQDVTRKHFDTAWTYNILFSLISGVILALLASPAAKYYDDPRIFDIVVVLALSTALYGFQNIGVIKFRKELEFRREFFFYTSIKSLSFIVTVSLAFLTRSYWALVLGSLTISIVTVVLSFVCSGYRPRLSFAKTHELFSFSIWMFLNNVLLFARTRGADLIVGRILGPRSLGLFTIGYEISNLPTTELIAPINRAILPGYAKIAADRFRLRAAFCNVIAVVAMVALPSAVGIAVVADPGIRLFNRSNACSISAASEVLASLALRSDLERA